MMTGKMVKVIIAISVMVLLFIPLVSCNSSERLIEPIYCDKVDTNILIIDGWQIIVSDNGTISAVR
jgi:hypothetical protein